MNTRLQVEDPAIKAIAGLNFVEGQLRLARGEPLPLAQSDIRWDGLAIDARLCVEDAFNGFAPQAVRKLLRSATAGVAIRIERGPVAQSEIPP